MNYPIAASLILILGACGAALHAGDTAKDNAKTIQGIWKVVKAQVNGENTAAESLKDVRFVFKGDIITYESPREKNSAKFKLDADQKPRRINTEVLDGDAKGQARLGIYHLSGDKLKLCWSKSTTRPTDFTTKEGDNFINL